MPLPPDYAPKAAVRRLFDVPEALLSIERSERAWRTVAAATADEAATVLAENLAGLRLETTREFPVAMAFKRPGFDEVRRSRR